MLKNKSASANFSELLQLFPLVSSKIQSSQTLSKRESLFAKAGLFKENKIIELSAGLLTVLAPASQTCIFFIISRSFV